MSESIVMFLMTESSLHAGTGSTLSNVDLPIQREVHTGFPIVYASGVKGGLRELCRGMQRQGKATKEEIEGLFGPEGDGEHGGLGIFQEARMVLFPVRSFTGVFGWITCPLALRRLQRDLRQVLPGLGELSVDKLEQVKAVMEEKIPEVLPGEARTTPTCGLRANKRLILEEYDYKGGAEEEAAEVGRIAAALAGLAVGGQTGLEWWKDKISKDVVLLSDEDFTFFVKVHTEVQTHININPDSGIVKFGPWNEESIPPDSLLYTVVTMPVPLQKSVQETFAKKSAATFLSGVLTEAPVVQICGDRSLGKGLIRVSMAGAREPNREQGQEREEETCRN